MMCQEGEFGYAEPRGLQVLELPYVGGELSMIVLLPKSVRGLASLEKALTATSLSKWTDRLGYTEVEVLLPRFIMRFGCELSVRLTFPGWMGGSTGCSSRRLFTRRSST
jgi:serine protease inhibitor